MLFGGEGGGEPQSGEEFKRLQWSFTWVPANLDKLHRIEGCTPVLACGKCVPETCVLFDCGQTVCCVRDSLSFKRTLQCLKQLQRKGTEVRYYLTAVFCFFNYFTGNANLWKSFSGWQKTHFSTSSYTEPFVKLWQQEPTHIKHAHMHAPINTLVMHEYLATVMHTQIKCKFVASVYEIL